MLKKFFRFSEKNFSTLIYSGINVISERHEGNLIISQSFFIYHLYVKMISGFF